MHCQAYQGEAKPSKKNIGGNKVLEMIAFLVFFIYLEIQMNDVLLMDVRDSLNNLPHESCTSFFTQNKFILYYSIEELATTNAEKLILSKRGMRKAWSIQLT